MYSVIWQIDGNKLRIKQKQYTFVNNTIYILISRVICTHQTYIYIHHITIDTSDFSRKINKIEEIPDNSYLVSMDLRSLYTSILNSEVIKVVKTSLDNFPRRIVATKVITTFLSLILTLNNFVFNCKNYLQIKGCTMGTVCAPRYANTLMNHFERKYIYSFLEGLSLSDFDDSLTIYSLYGQVENTS